MEGNQCKDRAGEGSKSFIQIAQDSLMIGRGGGAHDQFTIYKLTRRIHFTQQQVIVYSPLFRPVYFYGLHTLFFL